jgi:hypothetical protein
MFSQKVHALMFIMHMMVVPFIEMKGTTAPGCFEHQNTSLGMAMLMFVLMWYSIPWTSDVVLNFLFLCMVSREAPPPPSTV